MPDYKEMHACKSLAINFCSNVFWVEWGGGGGGRERRREPLYCQNILFTLKIAKKVWPFFYLFYRNEELLCWLHFVFSQTTPHISTVNRACVEYVGCHGNQAGV